MEKDKNDLDFEKIKKNIENVNKLPKFPKPNIESLVGLNITEKILCNIENDMEIVKSNTKSPMWKNILIGIISGVVSGIIVLCVSLLI